MSSSSWLRILHTAPIVSAFRGRDPARSEAAFSRVCAVLPAATPMSAFQVAELVLADLDLVGVLELVRLDAAAVDVGAVQRSEVIDIQAVLAAHDQRVVAGHRDVVEEHLSIGAASDPDAVAVDREALPRAPPARANHQRRSRL